MVKKKKKPKNLIAINSPPFQKEAKIIAFPEKKKARPTKLHNKPLKYQREHKN